VGALLHLVLGHLDAGVPVALEERLAEPLGAVGVGALADDHEAGVLFEGHQAVDRRGAVLELALFPVDLAATDRLGQTADVLGRGAAAAADDADAQLLDEAGLVLDELLGGEVVVHLAVDDRGQPGVGHDDDGHPAGLGQVAHVLGHLDRSGSAVDADDVGAHRIERNQRRRDLGAGQHAPGELDGHLHLDRDLTTHLGHGVPAGGHRRLGPQQIELGLDDVQVDAALEQAEC
jgi:hypothetical protein